MRSVTLSVGHKSSLITPEQHAWVQERIGKKDSYDVIGGVVNVKGSVRLRALDSEIFVPFGEVTGSFSCSHSMKSLVNAPVKCGKFYCEDNGELNSLEGLDLDCVEFDCSETQVSKFENFKLCTKRLYIGDTVIKSFRNIHKCVVSAEHIYCNAIGDSVLGLFFINGLISVSRSGQIRKGGPNNSWIDIVNKHLADGKSGVSGATREFIENGMQQYAKF